MRHKVRSRIIINDGVGSSLGGGSTAETEITYDITGSTDINLSGYSGTVIVNVTSTEPTQSETLNSFSNITNVKKVIVRPSATLTLTANDANAFPGPNINLYAPQLVVYGARKGFLEFVKRTSGMGSSMYQNNFIDQYNPAT